jgi:hypothetical protein
MGLIELYIESVGANVGTPNGVLLQVLERLPCIVLRGVPNPPHQELHLPPLPAVSADALHEVFDYPAVALRVADLMAPSTRIDATLDWGWRVGLEWGGSWTSGAYSGLLGKARGAQTVRYRQSARTAEGSVPIFGQLGSVLQVPRHAELTQHAPDRTRAITGGAWRNACER